MKKIEKTINEKDESKTYENINLESVQSKNENTNDYSNFESKNQSENEFISNSENFLSQKEKFLIENKEIEIKKEIGRGEYGKVSLGIWRSIKVAVKEVLISNLNKKEKENFYKEVELMKNLRPHSNVVLFYGLCRDPLLSISEYLSNGSLENYLKNEKENNLEFNLILQFLIGIGRGMYHLHCEKIIHRDLASRNVLLPESLIPKISDFGMSRYLLEGEDEGKTQSLRGPLRWMSPESISKNIYSSKSDVYSYAMTSIEIITRNKPFPDLEPIQVATLVSKNSLKPDISNIDLIPNWIKDLILKCCSFEPNERSSFQDICKKLELNEQIQKSYQKISL